MRIAHGPSPGADERVRRPGRAVQEVPLAQRALLLLDDRDALAREHEEALLHALGVVQRRALARLEHVHVDAEVLEAASGDSNGQNTPWPGRSAKPRAPIRLSTNQPRRRRRGPPGVSSMRASGIDMARQPTERPTL